MTDERLIQRASRGDEAAFLILYERHRAPVFRFAYRLLGSTELAEDVTHDCFLALIKRPANFDPTRAALRTYLYAAARNLANKHFRQRAGDSLSIDELTDEPRVAESEEPLSRLLDEEMAAAVRGAVMNLPPLQREAVVLFEYEGLSLAEIALVVGADVGTVKSRLYRAREGLRRSLSPYFKSHQRAAQAGRVYR